MSEDAFRQRRPEDDNIEKLERIEAMRKIADIDENDIKNPEGKPFQVKGSAPPEFLKAMGSQPQTASKSTPDNVKVSGNLQSLLEGLKQSTSVFEEIELPSRGVFYNGEDGPDNGILHIRPMTGEEEQILATPRFVRKGQALNMIFSRCVREKFKPEELLTIDRTYLLIYLRGISYSPKYDVEIKCPECEKKFSTEVDLNALNLEACPENYGPLLEDTLPTSKYKFRYRLSKGRDESDIQDHRDRRIKNFGDSAADDTLTYRTAILLEDVEGVADKKELQTLIKSLPISDVSYIRNCTSEPPFGVDTKIEIVCPSCLQEFEVDLPLESNFFFPRQRREKTQA